ncbi:MAG: hypothetical protein SPF21_07265 [Candidatus Methanomethylophilaceae archaeon]|nr:hypothetical protein [Candidatus Methanomethylophilaceae archaeon]
MSFGDWLFSLFDGLGPEWVLLCICLLFLLDAILIPTLPEVFFIMGFDRQPTALFGGELLLAAIIGELIGIFSLYYVVKHIRVPKRISKIADKYVNFLIVSDEKALLMNRIAPMIPFAGAFIALIESWDPKKCVFYIVTGCILKYGAILLASGFFYTFFTGRMAQQVMLVFIIAVIVVSFIASYVKKKRSGLEG